MAPSSDADFTSSLRSSASGALISTISTAVSGAAGAPRRAWGFLPAARISLHAGMRGSAMSGRTETTHGMGKLDDLDDVLEPALGAEAGVRRGDLDRRGW